MAVVAYVLAHIIFMPIAIILFQKYMRSADYVWKLNQKDREEALVAHKAHGPTLGNLYALIIISMAILIAVIIEWLS